MCATLKFRTTICFAFEKNFLIDDACLMRHVAFDAARFRARGPHFAVAIRPWSHCEVVSESQSRVSLRSSATLRERRGLRGNLKSLLRLLDRARFSFFDMPRVRTRTADLHRAHSAFWDVAQTAKPLRSMSIRVARSRKNFVGVCDGSNIHKKYHTRKHKNVLRSPATKQSKNRLSQAVSYYWTIINAASATTAKSFAVGGKRDLGQDGHGEYFITALVLVPVPS